jgi:transposase
MIPAMRAYSMDLRERIVQAVTCGQSKAAVARTFRVNLSTVKRYTAQYQRTGSVAPKPRPPRAARIGRAEQPALRAQLAAQPDATLGEHCAQWAATHGVQVSVPTMFRAIARLGWTPKKTMAAKLT